MPPARGFRILKEKLFAITTNYGIITNVPDFKVRSEWSGVGAGLIFCTLPKFELNAFSVLCRRGSHMHCLLGWVNLYQKFEIEKYTLCGKLILPKKWKGI